MRRAKQRGDERNAALVLGNVGDRGDADVPTPALDDLQPLMREHAVSALGRTSNWQYATWR
jgi:hypothetical protein